MNGMDVKSHRCCSDDLQSKDRQLFDLRGIREPNRWISTIPAKNNLFIAFQETSIAHFRPILKDVQIHQFGQSGVVGNRSCNHLGYASRNGADERVDRIVRIRNGFMPISSSMNRCISKVFRVESTSAGIIVF